MKLVLLSRVIQMASSGNLQRRGYGGHLEAAISTLSRTVFFTHQLPNPCADTSNQTSNAPVCILSSRSPSPESLTVDATERGFEAGYSEGWRRYACRTWWPADRRRKPGGDKIRAVNSLDHRTTYLTKTVALLARPSRFSRSLRSALIPAFAWFAPVVRKLVAERGRKGASQGFESKPLYL